MLKYKTIDSCMIADYNINKSRFIAHVKRTTTEEHAEEYIEQLRKKYWDANHNCAAYIIGGEKEKQKAYDDGEPSGTAGMPILDVLQKKDLSDITVVVTRYFGGIKLGASGLIRAYGHSASLVLSKALIVERTPFEKIKINFKYSLLGAMENYCHKNNIRILNKIYSDGVEFTILAITENYENITQSVLDIAAGTCRIIKLGEFYFDVPVAE
ncbi:YigZ family protein [Pectinatus sottacetonis]|uniref:YigZ family protein n=1 Tax=Pectinatus sottacetonis TaxID=1002795 RepID=UPI0018C51F72|nr:YigZ family protein [Pectinatus sottacetonis]